MLSENIFLGVLSSLFFVTFEIGEIAFFVILAILSIAVVIKIIKNKRKNKSVSWLWKLYTENYSRLLY